MVFTVHGIVPPLCCMYFLGLDPQKYIQPSRGTYPMHCKNHETITCTRTCIAYLTIFLHLTVALHHIIQQVFGDGGKALREHSLRWKELILFLCRQDQKCTLLTATLYMYVHVYSAHMHNTRSLHCMLSIM